MKPSHLLLLLLMNLLWGCVYSVYKVVGDVPGGGTAAIVTLRFGIAGLCLLAFWPWMSGPAPKGRDLLMTCLIGCLLYVFGQRLQVYGNHLGTAANSAVLIALEPIVTSLAAAIYLGEHVGPRRLGGFALGLLGIALLNGVWRPDFHWGGLAASLIFISSFVFEAVYSVVGKKIVQHASIIKMLTISLLTGTAVNLLLDGQQTVSLAKALPLKGWLLISGIGIFATALGYTVWFVVIRDCPVSVAVLTIFAQAVFGVLIAAWWLGEALRWDQLFGSLTIAAGLVLGLSRQMKPSQANAQR